MNELIIIVKGAGEMATGIAIGLYKSHFRKVLMLETLHPVAVRRKVSFCEAVFEGCSEVEGVVADRVSNTNMIYSSWEKGHIPVLVDPEWKSITDLKPDVVIDAVIAKKNLGTNRSEAPLVIGLGPGFEAGVDVHTAIETNRGHHLGRILQKGCPEPNTGIPGNIGGHTKNRVLYPPCPGIFKASLSIGAKVKKNDIIGYVEDKPVTASIDGVLRGRIRDKSIVDEKRKIGDIDPRGEKAYCTTLSEKARAIAGSVIQAILIKYNQ